MLKYNDATIQLLDLPGIIEGAAQGKGNGRQVLAVAKASDLLLIMLDPHKGVEQKAKIEKELDDMGIRINRRPPDITIRDCKGGGVKLNSTIKLTHVNLAKTKNQRLMNKWSKSFARNTRNLIWKLSCVRMRLPRISSMRLRVTVSMWTRSLSIINVTRYLLKTLMSWPEGLIVCQSLSIPS
jgi:GTPase involved in cell partitioning and DNA repair